jgi:16S rRNA (cytosine967-C5)-methyltransferase
MNPAARLKAVIDILDRIGTSRIPMDLTVGDYMRNRRYIGSKDRADIVERVYTIARYQARLGWALEQAGAPDNARMRALALLLVLEKRKEIEHFYDGSRYGPEVLTDDEKTFIPKLAAVDLAQAPETVRLEVPSNYEPSLRAYFGDEFAVEMAAMLEGANLDLRVNTVSKTREEVKESLLKDSVDTTELPYSPWGLRTKGKVYLSHTKAFKAGWIDIQDEGSQLIALACNARPGQQVLDYCAGGGGKTLALANAMKVKGRIVAMDTEEARLLKSKERFRRARVSDIIEVRPLSDDRHRKWLKRQKETFDVTLVDAPCTGTGTWRRNPDTRWKTYGPGLDALLPMQAEILDKVVHTVKPGGRLVYATCSILPEENEAQVAAFLERHPDFELANLKDVWPDGVTPPCEGKYMRLTPHRHGTDGFFAAILVKKTDIS